MPKRIAGPIENGDVVMLDEKKAGYRKTGKFEVIDADRVEKDGTETLECLNDRGQLHYFVRDQVILVGKGKGGAKREKKTISSTDPPRKVRRKK